MSCIRSWRAGLWSLAAALLIAGSASADEVVLSGQASVRVFSSDAETERTVLSAAESSKAPLLIMKTSDGGYVWSSREGRRLAHVESGAYHYFIDPRGGGFVKILDQAVLPEFLRTGEARVQWFETISTELSTITYWGSSESFNP